MNIGSLNNILRKKLPMTVNLFKQVMEMQGTPHESCNVIHNHTTQLHQTVCWHRSDKTAIKCIHMISLICGTTTTTKTKRNPNQTMKQNQAHTEDWELLPEVEEGHEGNG